MSDKLVVRGAREHNLRNVSLELPRDKLIVFTGLSGSGKSSLAFDTIYAEGQRRYVESLSAYARQFLGQMDKPDVDFIEGLSPAISIDQKSASRNPRSTVGTITEIYDYLRLLYARIGVPHCPDDGTVVQRQTPQQIVDRILELPDGTRFQVLAPVVRGRKGEYEGLLEELAVAGLRPGPDRRRGPRAGRPAQAGPLRAAHHRGGRRPAGQAGRHRAAADRLAGDGPASWPRGWPRSSWCPGRARSLDEEILTFSQHLACPTCGLSFDELAPRNFSFNSPYGACPHCAGLGTKFEVDPELVVPDPDLSIDEGAIQPVGRGAGRVLQPGARRGGRRPTASRPRRRGSKLKKSDQKVLLYGSGTKQVHVQYRNRYGRTRSLPHPLRGGRPVAAAAALRGRVRPHAGDASRATCARCRARCAAGPGSSPSRWRSPSTAATSSSCATCRSATSTAAMQALRAVRARPPDRRPGAEGDPGPHAVPARRRARLPDASTGRPAPWPAARRSASGWPRRSAAAWSACCTCSTSRRSGCTSGTTAS